MADGFRFRLAVRRGSCEDLVSRLADGAEGDEEGQIVRIDYAPGGLLRPPEMSNLETLKISGAHRTEIERGFSDRGLILGVAFSMTRIQFCRLSFMRRD